MTREYKNITVAGAGTAGYLAVAFLCKTFPDKSIRWIYPEVNNPIGVGEATVPDVHIFLRKIGVSSEDILDHCKGTIKFGFRFDEFSGVKNKFFHAFPLYDEHCRQQRVTAGVLHPESDIGFHFNVNLLTTLIESKLQVYKNLSIIRKEVSFNDVRSTADLVVDCTGLSKTILRAVEPNNNFVSIEQLIPNNSAYIYRHRYTNSLNQIQPYSIATAMKYGWIWNLFLRNEMTFGYVHSDSFDVRREFIDFIEHSTVSKIDESKIKKIKFTTGRCKTHIVEGAPPVAAVGLSSSFVEPMESTSLFMSTFSIELLCDYIKEKITADEYNLMINKEYNSIVSFILAHYKYAKRSNEYWDRYKQMDVDLYSESAIFDEWSWNSLLTGLGIKEPSPRNLVEIAARKLDVSRGTPYPIWLRDYGYS